MPRLQPEDVTYSVHQIALARAVRPDDRREVLAFPKIDGVRAAEGFETLYFQFHDAAARLLDVHVGHFVLCARCAAQRSFEHCCERRSAGLAKRGSRARLCDWAVLRASRLFERLAVRGALSLGAQAVYIDCGTTSSALRLRSIYAPV